MKRKQACNILTGIKKALQMREGAFIVCLGINQANFEDAYKCFSQNTLVVLKRQVNEVWINQYSKPLLKCYNANLDIQFVIDAFSCCIWDFIHVRI